MSKAPYVKAPFPRKLFEKFNRLARQNGFRKRGERWRYLDLILDNANLPVSKC